MYGLRRPQSLQFYCLNDSYINPYYCNLGLNKQADNSAQIESLYEDPKLEQNPKKNNKQISLRFLTKETGEIIEIPKES